MVAAPPPPAPPCLPGAGDIISTAELCEAANVSQPTVSRWGAEGLNAAAKVGRGKWRREDALAWIADRREDSLAFDDQVAPALGSDGASPRALLEARTRLYVAQGDGAHLRNEILAGNLVLRESAQTAYQEGYAACIAAGDRWVRTGTTAREIEQRRELWYELRRELADAVERVARTLARGEDVGSSRVRLPRRVGG